MDKIAFVKILNFNKQHVLIYLSKFFDEMMAMHNILFNFDIAEIGADNMGSHLLYRIRFNDDINNLDQVVDILEKSNISIYNHNYFISIINRTENIVEIKLMDKGL